MQGRVKRKQQAAKMAEQLTQNRAEAAPICEFCQRPLGSRVEWHHPLPKSEGGIVTVPVHPICHRTIHAHVSNHDLAARYSSLADLREREDLQRFLAWIADKPPDFHAPTRHKRSN